MRSVLRAAAACIAVLVPAISQGETWQEVDTGGEASGQWEEVHCDSGSGWQVCERSGGATFQTVIAFPRDVLRQHANRNLPLQMPTHRKVTGRIHGPFETGFHFTPSANMTGNVSQYSNKNMVNVFPTTPRPEGLNGCAMNVMGFCVKPTPIVHITLPSSISVTQSHSFFQLAQSTPNMLFQFLYSTHLLNHNVNFSRDRGVNQGKVRLHSNGNNLSFGFTHPLYSGSMTAQQFRQTSSTNFFIPDLRHVTVQGEVMALGSESPQALAAWAGVPVHGTYRFGMPIAVYDQEPARQQRSNSGWNYSQFSDRVSVTYELIPQ